MEAIMELTICTYNLLALNRYVGKAGILHRAIELSRVVTFWDGMGIKAFFEVNKNIFTT
jgi:hypothetical protein